MHWRLWFILVPLVLGVLVGAHWYVAGQLIRAWDDPPAGTLIVHIAAILLALAFPFAQLFANGRAGRFGHALDKTASVWLGCFFYAFVLTLLLDGARALAGATGLWAQLAPHVAPHGGRVVVAAVAAIALTLGASGVREAARAARWTTLEAPLKNLPAALDGLTVVQVSDLHFGPFFGPDRLADLVSRVNEARPDLVLITGDLVDREGAHYEELTAGLRELRATHGVIAITGNHDAMAGVEHTIRAAEAAGVTVLRGGRRLVAGAIDVYGVDDETVLRLAGRPPLPLDRVIGPEATSRPTILLHHRPTEVADAARLGVDLMLSGHTHRGQVWPLTYVSRLFYPCQYGSYRFGGMLLFVSRGVGTWGPPMRVGSPPEIVRITLRTRDAADRAR